VFGPEPSAGDEADGPRNLLIHGENLAVMESLLRVYRGRINLIYIDPPFDLGIDLAMQAPVGEGRNGDGDGPAVIEVLAYRDKWGNGREPYAEMMRRRLALMRELLSETGSVYVHCDYRTNAVLRLMLDEIFGRDRLCNEIIWHYQSGGRQRGRFSMKHDTIFLYTRSEKWTFNLEAIGRPRGAVRRNHMKRQVDADGRTSFTIRSAGRIYTYYEDDLLTPPDVWTWWRTFSAGAGRREWWRSGWGESGFCATRAGRRCMRRGSG
jgi:site-specific DNA-methyltransferase (adenine-specific)/adenine-specific DNA-methyltransferase